MSVRQLLGGRGRVVSAAAGVTRRSWQHTPVPQPLQAALLGWAPCRGASTGSGGGPTPAGGGGASASTAAGASTEEAGKAEPLEVTVVHIDEPSTGARALRLFGIAAGLAAVGSAGYISAVHGPEKLYSMVGLAPSEEQTAEEPAKPAKAAKSKAAEEKRAKAKAKEAASASQAAAEAAAAAAASAAVAKEERMAWEEAARAKAMVAVAAAEQEAALGRVAAALAGAAGAASEAAAEALRSALRAATEAQAPQDAQCVVDGMQRLQEIDQINEAQQDIVSAREGLQEAVLGRYASNLRDLLDKVGNAQGRLAALNVAVANDDEDLVEEARVVLNDLEKSEREAALREEALQGLREAIQSRDVARCGEAVERAKLAQVGPCTSLELAELLADPDRLLQSVASEGVNHIFGRTVGLGLAEGRADKVEMDHVTEAARTVASKLDEPELRSRAAKLARDLAVRRKALDQEIQEELASSTARLEQVYEARWQEASARILADSERKLQERQAELDALWQQRETEEVEQLAQKAKAMAEQQIELIQQEGQYEMEASVAKVQEDSARSVAALTAGVALAGALHSFHRALVEGRPSHAGLQQLKALSEKTGSDDLVARLLAQLPEETVAATRRALPTEEELTRSFHSQLRPMAQAAFALPAHGLLSGYASGLLSWSLSRLFVLRVQKGQSPVTGPSGKDEHTAAAEDNLRTLARAAHLVDQGDLAGAVQAMESSLTGNCRQAAESGWLEPARRTLQLQQVVKAALAQFRILNANLV